MRGLLAGLVRGEVREWPFDHAGGERDFLEEATRHGVLPLVAWQLRREGAGQGWPAPLLEAIRARARHHAVAEQVQRLELVALTRALRDRGVRAIVFKGAALAYTHYPYPCHRPRTDVDLLIAESQAGAAAEVLHSRGYSPLPMNTGRLVTFQQTFVRLDDTGVRHACDLHWQIANRPACAALLRFDEIAREARAVADLDGAAAPSPPHALLIACLHRLVHHHDAPTLIWIYDLHLLASAMTPAEAERTRGLAEEKRLAAVCAAALAAAHGLFGTVVPGPLRELRARGPEPLAIFLEDGLRPLDVLALDLRALPGWRARCQLLREHLFPPREYLQAIEGRLGRGPLPLLYARRVVRGASRWFRPAPREF